MVRSGGSSGGCGHAYAVSTFGTWIAFDAFPLIAILVLHASAAQVSLLAAAGLADGRASSRFRWGPWVELRRKRRRVSPDLARGAALLSVAGRLRARRADVSRTCWPSRSPSSAAGIAFTVPPAGRT